mgnify:CR=1 FL=1|jgi:hypothetical protein
MLTVQADLSNKVDSISEALSKQMKATTDAIDEESERVDKLTASLEQYIKL